MDFDPRKYWAKINNEDPISRKDKEKFDHIRRAVQELNKQKTKATTRGQWIHGTRTCYEYRKCRCFICKTKYYLIRRKDRPPNKSYKHGTHYSYDKKKCRCEICVKAREIWKTHQKKKFSEIDRTPKKAITWTHGTTGYNNKKCRCEICCKARSDQYRNKVKWNLFFYLFCFLSLDVSLTFARNQNWSRSIIALILMKAPFVLIIMRMVGWCAQRLDYSALNTAHKECGSLKALVLKRASDHHSSLPHRRIPHVHRR